MAINRYVFNNDTSKVNRSELQLSSSIQFKNQLYKLSSIVSHTGYSPKSGHYVAYVSVSNKSEWYKMDDERVIKMEEKSVFEECLSSCYILFYIKQLQQQ